VSTVLVHVGCVGCVCLCRAAPAGDEAERARFPPCALVALCASQRTQRCSLCACAWVIVALGTSLLDVMHTPTHNTHSRSCSSFETDRAKCVQRVASPTTPPISPSWPRPQHLPSPHLRLSDTQSPSAVHLSVRSAHARVAQMRV
jgi:hypothetical protein